MKQALKCFQWHLFNEEFQKLNWSPLLPCDLGSAFDQRVDENIFHVIFITDQINFNFMHFIPFLFYPKNYPKCIGIFYPKYYLWSLNLSFYLGTFNKTEADSTFPLKSLLF